MGDAIKTADEASVIYSLVKVSSTIDLCQRRHAHSVL